MGGEGNLLFPATFTSVGSQAATRGRPVRRWLAQAWRGKVRKSGVLEHHTGVRFQAMQARRTSGDRDAEPLLRKLHNEVLAVRMDRQHG